MNANRQKIAIVTGANTGLGYETSLGLAKAGHTVILACRTEAKAKAAMDKINRKVKSADLDFIALDLVDRPSIEKFAQDFGARYDHLDVLVNNAGVMGPEYTITQNDLELQFDANHIGHFYLTSQLMDRLDQEFETRIVNVASLAGKRDVADIHFDNLNFEGTYDQGWQFMGLTGMEAYAQSKLANILFTLGLRDRLEKAGKNIKSIVVHPGASNTDLSRNMPARIRFLAPILAKFMNVSTPAQGAQSSLLAALGADVESGDFIGPTGKNGYTGTPGPCEFTPTNLDEDLRKKLWTVSEKLLGKKFKV